MVYVQKSVVEMDVICHIKDSFKLLTLKSEQVYILLTFCKLSTSSTHFLQICKKSGLLNARKKEKGIEKLYKKLEIRSKEMYITVNDMYPCVTLMN